MRVTAVVALAGLVALGCGRSPLRGERGSTSNGAGGGGGAPTTSITSTSITSTSITTSVSGTSVTTSVSGTSVTSSVSGTSSSSSSSSSASSSASSSSSSGAFCGNGMLEPGEACDDGNLSNNDACLVSCQIASCGDGFIHFGFETCDDGNLIDGDGCSSTCAAATCGDGVLEGMEQCDLGALNEERPALQIAHGMASLDLVPVSQPGAAALFYDYFSASSHTGFEALGASRIFFYLDASTGVLSLVMHHGIDFNTSGQHQPMSHVVMGFTALPTSTTVSLSDDTPGEFQKTGPTTANGNWNFNDNSDGGVLSGFPFPGSWSVGLTTNFQSGINSWTVLGGDGEASSLGLVGGATLTAFDSPSACRLDCTIPACGDGRLDGGEVCDDGNATDGDGCESDCLLTSVP